MDAKKPRLILLTFLITFFFQTPVLPADQETTADGDSYPVLLIHGLASEPGSWANLPDLLRNRGYDVYVLDFNYWNWLELASSRESGLDQPAAVLARQIALVKRETGAKKVNIIAHSISGIVVRAYIAGWGKHSVSWGGYGYDIATVIYLGTPHYGINLTKPYLRKLLRETDFGNFLDRRNFQKALVYGSYELLELHKFFQEYGDQLGIEEITVSSQDDNVVKEYCANLDGQWSIPLAPAVLPESRHVHLDQYKHAYAYLLGSSPLNLIEVDTTDHPVYRIAHSVFRDKTSWKKLRTRYTREGTITYIEFIEGDGINPNALNLTNVKLKKIMSPQRMKNIKLKRNTSSGVFFVHGLKSGRYELTLPFRGDPEASFRFELQITGNSGTVVCFDPNDPPPDPDDGDGGDDGDDGDDDGGNEDIPKSVKDYDTLRQFVLARFPKKAKEWLSGGEMLALCGNVRNSLVSSYANIVLPPVYLDENDKFTLKDSDTTIDFVSGSNDPGILLNKLQWTPVENTRGEPPADVYSKDTLLEFVDCYFYDEVRANNDGETNGELCMKIRDKLAQKYSKIERVNDQEERYGYSAPDYKHADAIYRTDIERIIDFALDGDGPGILLDRLQWAVCNDLDNYPW